MPSRKKAKGQARKAAKAINEAVETMRQMGEVFRDLEQSQIQRLQNSNAQSSVLCMHGFDPFPNDDVCIKFIRAFIHEFYKCYIKSMCEVHMIERPASKALSKARDAKKDEYSEVWNTAAKMKHVISYFLHNGPMLILADAGEYARHSAILGRFFEEWL